MKKDDLLEIIRNGESSKVEFKNDQVHPNSLAEEFVSFANFDGGLLLLGVEDDGTISGCRRSDIEDFTINVCRNNIRPSLIPTIEKVFIDDKLVVAVTISRGDSAHSTSRGHYYIRIGSTKQIPTQQELLRLFQKRNLLQFDETPVIKDSIESLDISKINWYLERMGQSPLTFDPPEALLSELRNLSILVNLDGNHYPTLAGLLSFGKNPQQHFPSYTIRCGAYHGEDALSESIREKSLAGTYNEIIEDAVAFLKLLMPQRSSLTNGIRRKEAYLYPVEALREAIVNAVCHRDYTITGSAIRINLFADRMEIRSPGGLPNTLTIQNMLYRQFSRNQMIASFLTGTGYMEQRGKGILKIRRLCEKNGLKATFFLTPDAGEFVVSLKK